jgi:hypothetical protein
LGIGKPYLFRDLGCYEKVEEIMTKATNDFWVAAAQAGLAAAVR